jgi:hypothetical protein
MKFFLFVQIFVLMVFNSLLFATVYESAEDESIKGWMVYDKTPTGATISNIEDNGNRVIQLQGDGIKNGYLLGDWSGGANVWNNTKEKTITWRMKYDEDFVVYVSVETKKGHRFIYYDDREADGGWISKVISGHGIDSKYIHYGLGSDASDGTWRTYIRDLEEDLKEVEPDNVILSVNGIHIRGSGLVDDIQLLPKRIYEHAEDKNTNGWKVYDDTPAGSSISNEFDTEKGDRVIKLRGSGTNNGYILGDWSGGANAWNNSTEKVIKWSMKYNEEFVVYVSVETIKGHRYLYYTNSNQSWQWRKGEYLHHGLGSTASDGTWRTFTRDLESDLKDLESDNALVSVNAFLIRGSGLVDNIEMSNQSIVLNRITSYKFAPQDRVDYITLSKDETKAYVTGKDLIVLDIADINNIKEIGRYSGVIGKVEISPDGTKAYIMKNGLTLLDISDANHIVELSNLSTFKSGIYNEYDTSFNPKDIELSSDGTKIYMSNYDEWYFAFAIIDVSDAFNPMIIGQYDRIMEGWGIALSPDGTKVFNLWDGLDLVDVSNPKAPTLLDVYPGGSSVDLVFSKDGRKAYLYEGLGRELTVLDLTDPFNIKRISSYHITNDAVLNKITLSKDEKVAYLSGGNIFRLIDISDSNNLYEIFSFSQKYLSDISISKDDSRVYLLNNTKNELMVLKMN